MKPGLALLRNLVFDLPKQGKIAYCLLRDERVPKGRKVALAGAGVVILSPLNIPEWVPVLGEMEVAALSVLALRVFIRSCPEAVVREHQEAAEVGDSRFDRDLHRASGHARSWAATLWERLRRWVGNQ